MTPKAMPTLHEVLGPPGGRPSSPPRSFCCRPVSWPPGAPTKIAPLLVVVGSAELPVWNGKFVGGGLVICGELVEVVIVDVKIGGIDSVVDSDVKVLDVLESESVSDSVDVVDVLLELVSAAGGVKVGGGGGGEKDVESSSSSSSSVSAASTTIGWTTLSSSTALNLSSSSSSLLKSGTSPSTKSVRPQIESSSSCCLADKWTAARWTLLRRALTSKQDQHNGSSTCGKRATIFAPAQYLQQRIEPKSDHFFSSGLRAAAQA